MSPNQDKEMADVTASTKRPDRLDEEDEEPVQSVIRPVRWNHSICRHTISKLTDFKLQGSTATAASYEFKNEDHTLGNALRHIIMKKYASLFIAICVYANSDQPRC